MSAFVLPQADILLRAFARRDPDLLLVHQVGVLVRARRLLIAQAVRQHLLARVRDLRQFARLDAALSAFPAPRIDGDDHRAAARLALRLRESGAPLSEGRALAWAVAARLGAMVWSDEPAWSALARHGCPLFAP